MKTNHYFILLGCAAAAFSLVGCDKTESHQPTPSAEIKDYRELYRNDEKRAQQDWAECKKLDGPLSDKCRMARQYGQTVYQAPAAGFSSQGGSK